MKREKDKYLPDVSETIVFECLICVDHDVVEELPALDQKAQKKRLLSVLKNKLKMISAFLRNVLPSKIISTKYYSVCFGNMREISKRRQQIHQKLLTWFHTTINYSREIG